MNAKKITGLALAATAAAMFATAPMTASAGGHAKGQCAGVNACKGHSSCKMTFFRRLLLPPSFVRPLAITIEESEILTIYCFLEVRDF